ncbi:hypothetical protein PBY51_005845 [Eleginops maclovinus]|uniref:Uncharacterized protein n=1 Tax=Eleginops maclovinus TaxID=56733 RepID=A0AAN7WSI7_ELEMC|nr:hypothetical protein PBY51_005845 [Eleginops maclovinus]
MEEQGSRRGSCRSS